MDRPVDRPPDPSRRGRDEPWVIDGAAVQGVVDLLRRRADDAWVLETQLDGQRAPRDEIYTDLTARRGAFGVDLTGVRNACRRTRVWLS